MTSDERVLQHLAAANPIRDPRKLDEHSLASVDPASATTRRRVKMTLSPVPKRPAPRMRLRWVFAAAAVVVAAAVGGTVWLLQSNGDDSLPMVDGPGETTVATAPSTTVAPVTTAPGAVVTQPEEPSLVVAVGEGGTILTSSDASTWIAQDSGTDRDLEALATDGDLWVVVGAAGTILTSSDGTAWTPQTSGTDGDLFGVATGNAILGIPLEPFSGRPVSN